MNNKFTESEDNFPALFLCQVNCHVCHTEI
nr:MAG TPA: cytochrome C6 [Caudoviricetes sp.]